jgi:hypothetical protein
MARRAGCSTWRSSGTSSLGECSCLIPLSRRLIMSLEMQMTKLNALLAEPSSSDSRPSSYLTRRCGCSTPRQATKVTLTVTPIPTPTLNPMGPRNPPGLPLPCPVHPTLPSAPANPLPTSPRSNPSHLPDRGHRWQRTSPTPRSGSRLTSTSLAISRTTSQTDWLWPRASIPVLPSALLRPSRRFVMRSRTR